MSAVRWNGSIVERGQPPDRGGVRVGECVIVITGKIIMLG
jgi:hypothetical protein